jgi:hypothetical protein
MATFRSLAIRSWDIDMGAVPIAVAMRGEIEVIT